jgi:hypothetical protein
MAEKKKKPQDEGLKSHRMPEKSFLYDRLIPIVLIVFGMITVLLIVIAAGVLTGIIPWS